MAPPKPRGGLLNRGSMDHEIASQIVHVCVHISGEQVHGSHQVPSKIARTTAWWFCGGNLWRDPRGRDPTKPEGMAFLLLLLSRPASSPLLPCFWSPVFPVF